MHPSIQPVADAVTTANVLVYGPSGVGKTALGATAPGRKLFLNAEGGMLTVRGDESVSVWKVNTMSDLREATDYIAENPTEFPCVVMDSLTEVQRIMADDIRGNSDKLTLPQYGVLKNRTEALIRTYRDMPVNFVATALLAEQTDGDGNVSMRRPMLQGAVKDTVGQFFDVVALMGAANDGTRSLVVEPGPSWVAKSRVRIGRVAPCNLSEIFDALFGAAREEAEDVPSGFIPGTITTPDDVAEEVSTEG